MLRGMGCPDKPVSKISEDLFDVSSYVDGLCSFVRSCDTPMTISIQGDWGSGKTSMMNMMKENLETSICPIWFNTWQFSQFNMGNSLVFSMMNVLLDELDCDNVVIKKILGGISGFARNVIRVATDRVAGGAAESMVSDALSAEPTDAAKEICKLKEEFQKAINKKLEKEHKDRVVVFVDDLDRLQPIKAIELLEALKIFLDCEKCVFILAVDYEVVTLGIKEKFGDNVSEEKGRSFFDKIIQLPFKMPVAQYHIQDYVKEMMNRMSITPSKKDTELYTDLIKTSIGCNPRSMKRLFNTFQLLDIISKDSSKKDINKRKRVLFATVCAQMSFEEFYLYLTSTEIDVDTLLTLSQDSRNSEDLREFYPDDAPDIVEKKIKKLSAFIPYFIASMKSENSDELSEEDVGILNDMIKYSVVTSVNAESNDKNKELYSGYRTINKDIVKKTNALLNDIGEYDIHMTHRAHDDLQIYDIFGKQNAFICRGLSISLDYCVTRKDESHIAVNLYITNKEKSKRKQFFETFDALDDDLLNLKISPITDRTTKTAGSYKFADVLSLDVSDTEAPEKIANVVRNAYLALTETNPNN